MSRSGIKAFWSYVHKDDEAESGRIVQLGKDIAAQYEMVTGEKIDLFIDRADLVWGDEWKRIIDDNLMSFAYFIPVITTRYFDSVECRRELTVFSEKAQSLGMESLIMPILYCDTKQLSDSSNNDIAVEIIRKFQWEEWQDIRFEEPSSSTYRRSVAKLAERLSSLNEAIEIKPAPTETLSIEPKSIKLADHPSTPPQADLEEDGFLDKIAEMETAIPEWTNIMNLISSEVNMVSQLTTEANDELNKLPSQLGITARIPIFKRLANKLDPHAEKISELGNNFTEEAYKVDSGIRAIIQLREYSEDSSSVEQINEFKASILKLNDSAQEGLGALKNMLEPMEPIEAMSRDMRRPLRKIRRGITSMYESKGIIDEWVELIQEAPEES